VPRTQRAMSDVPFLKRTEIQVAIVAGLFGLITAIATEAVKEHQSAKQPASPQAQIAVTNVSNIQNGPAPPPAANLLSLQQFTLNTADSPFSLCTPVDDLCRRYPTDKMAHWEPTEQYWDKNHINHGPVFDVVLSNGLSQSVVLTSIDVVLYRERLMGQGDSAPPPSGGVLPAMHRYNIKLTNSDSSPEDGQPFTKSTAAVPPLEILSTRSGRFQVSLQNTTDDLEVFDMKLLFHFGSNGTLTTEMVRVGF